MRIVGRGEEGFEEARVDRIFNRRLPTRQPAGIVRPRTEDEVVAAERGWHVAVRPGGHSWAQWSVRDDALTIDLPSSKAFATWFSMAPVTVGQYVGDSDLRRRILSEDAWERLQEVCAERDPDGRFVGYLT